jgi:hypothetical protein
MLRPFAVASVLVVGAASACGEDLFVEASKDGGPDAPLDGPTAGEAGAGDATKDGGDAGTCTSHFRYKNVRLVKGLENFVAASPRLSADERVVHFQRRRDDAGVAEQHIVVATRTTIDDPFNVVRELKELAESIVPFDPTLTQDGKWIYVGGTPRDGGPPSVIQVARRASNDVDAAFGKPTTLSLSNTGTREQQPFLARNDTELWFSLIAGNASLTHALRGVDGSIGAAFSGQAVGEAPVLSSDGKRILFAKRTASGIEIHGADVDDSGTITNETPVLGLDAAVTARQLPGWLTPGDERLYFTRDLAGTGAYKIYVADCE